MADDEKKGTLVMSVPIKKRKKLSELLRAPSPEEMTDEELSARLDTLMDKVAALIQEEEGVVRECVRRIHSKKGMSRERLLGELLHTHQEEGDITWS